MAVRHSVKNTAKCKYILENNEEATLNINIHYIFCHQIGDLPDQEAAPEENVLFVCKLNPVTTDEDLEIIFSRFGAIKR